MAERAQPQKAQDKLAFLLSLVPYLMDHDRVSVAETAAHFGVPEEQIRDAVRLISVSGIPGETASYQHGDLFDISWDDFEFNDTAPSHLGHAGPRSVVPLAHTVSAAANASEIATSIPPEPAVPITRMRKGVHSMRRALSARQVSRLRADQARRSKSRAPQLPIPPEW